MALDAPPWPIEELAADLDAPEAERAARFHFQRDARRYRAAHGMLRRVLARHLGIAPRDVRFSVGDAGKPSLTGPGTAALSFNLSHSGGYALLGLTRAVHMGVDTEVVRELADRDGIVASHFAPAEQRALHALPPQLQTDDRRRGDQQRLRPDREHDPHLLPPHVAQRSARRHGPNRPADRQHARLHPRRAG